MKFLLFVTFVCGWLHDNEKAFTLLRVNNALARLQLRQQSMEFSVRLQEGTLLNNFLIVAKKQ